MRGGVVLLSLERGGVMLLGEIRRRVVRRHLFVELLVGEGGVRRRRVLGTLGVRRRR